MVTVKHRGVTWRQFLHFFTSQKPWMTEALAEFDVTPQMAHALHVLPAPGGLTMGELALELACDNSNATGIVDRLEARGFVERRPATHDRRVKCVALTAAGKRMRRRINERFEDVPPALAALSDADQRALHDIFERVLAHAVELRVKQG